MKIEPKLTVWKSNTNLLVFGKKGYGKTSFVRGLLAEHSRVIFVDVMGYEYDETDGQICDSYHEFLTYLRRDTEKFRLVFRGVETDSLFRLFVRHLTKTTLVLEEADCYPKPDLEILIEHLRRGRHRENNLVTITRHPVELDDEYRKHADIIVSFQQDDVNVLSYLSKINREAVQELPLLGRGEYRVLTGKAFFDEFAG